MKKLVGEKAISSFIKNLASFGKTVDDLATDKEIDELCNIIKEDNICTKRPITPFSIIAPKNIHPLVAWALNHLNTSNDDACEKAPMWAYQEAFDLYCKNYNITNRKMCTIKYSPD